MLSPPQLSFIQFTTLSAHIHITSWHFQNHSITAAQVASLLLSNNSHIHTEEANNNQATINNTQAVVGTLSSSSSSSPMDKCLRISRPTHLVHNTARTTLVEARMVAIRQLLAQEERLARTMGSKVHQQDTNSSRFLSNMTNMATPLDQMERGAWEPWLWVSHRAAACGSMTSVYTG